MHAGVAVTSCQQAASLRHQTFRPTPLSPLSTVIAHYLLETVTVEVATLV